MPANDGSEAQTGQVTTPGAVDSTRPHPARVYDYLAASHGSAEYDPQGMARVERSFRRSGVVNQFRTADEFAAVAFTGLDMVEPGVVPVMDWRPADSGPRPLPAEVGWNGGVGRKPVPQ